VAILAATLVVAAVAHGLEGPTREEYVALVEPICEKNTLANQRILKDVNDKVHQGKLDSAAAQFIRASQAFAATIREIAAVPRPVADDARLRKWFGFLKIVRLNLRNTGKALKEGDEIKAAHETVRTQRSANAANNVSFIFGFRYCRLTPSHFR
jgi:hypothetical protein